MGIVYRASSAAVQIDTGLTLTLSAPAGTLASDILIAVIEFEGGTGETWTPPAGWTLIGRKDNSTTIGVVAYWAHGNVASFAFAVSPTITAVGWVNGYFGVNQVTPIDATAVGNTGSGTVATCASITTVTNGAVCPCIAGFNSASTFSGATFTQRQNGIVTGSSDPDSMDSGDFTQTVHGATATKTTTASSTAAWAALTAALRPQAEVPHVLQAIYRGVELQ